MGGRRGHIDELEAGEEATPITRSEAVALLDNGGEGGPFGTMHGEVPDGVRFSECDALVDIVIVCRRLARGPGNEGGCYFGWRVSELLDALSWLVSIKRGLTPFGVAPDDSSWVRDVFRAGLRKVNDEFDTRDIAKQHLREAARLLGIREDLFYRLPEDQPRFDLFPHLLDIAGPEGAHIRHWTPLVEGETPEEHERRRDLNRLPDGGFGTWEDRFWLERYAHHDRPEGGEASLRAYATRIVWSHLACEAQTVARGIWHPHAAVADILTWVGFTLTSKDVRSTVVNM